MLKLDGMRENKIKKGIEILNHAIDNSKTIAKSCAFFGLNEKYLRKLRANVDFHVGSGVSTQDEANEFLELYKKFLENSNKPKVNKNASVLDFDFPLNSEDKEVQYDADQDENYDERSVGETLRTNETYVDRNGNTLKKIFGYRYKILIHGENPLEGELTREEMDMVYRLYSNLDGAGLTLRTVSRYFPKLTFRDFKRILRAFNITKQSIPIAPHTLEENSEEEILQVIFRNKENNILKKLESERGKHVEKILLETQKELINLKGKFSDLKEMISGIDLTSIEPFRIDKKTIEDEKAIVIYLSDQHIGAHTKEDSIYQNKYDEQEFNSRMLLTFEKIVEQFTLNGRFDNIIVCNLGDSLDGYNAQTTRMGHPLPQNLGNKGQFNVYLRGMIKFFETLHQANMSNNIEYHCVTDDNHAGDFGYMANRALEVYLNLRFPDMKVNIFEKFIQYFSYGVHSFILCHGKDKEDMNRGFPLTLEPKTESFFNGYIDSLRIYSPNIHVVLGDLHQSMTQFSRRFRWKRVLSMYGASKWIHTNFGESRAGLDFDIVKKNSQDVLEGRIWFN